MMCPLTSLTSFIEDDSANIVFFFTHVALRENLSDTVIINVFI